MTETLEVTPAWTARYEDLRSWALAQGGEGEGGWGMALLQRQGVVAWMHAWPSVAAPSENNYPAPTMPATRPPSSSLPEALVLVVINMILTREEVFP